MAELLEAIMLICFGLSWPLNAYKNYRAGTAVGTSWQFIALITAGYFAGIAAKFVSGNLNWVLIVYSSTWCALPPTGSSTSAIAAWTRSAQPRWSWRKESFVVVA